MTEEKRLRSGFTTGTCAAAAAKAAAQMLFSGRRQERTAVITPAGRTAEFSLESVETEPAVWPGTGLESVRCAVRKDAGDDPDVTNAARIVACVRRIRKLPDGLRFYECQEAGLPLYITGGTGIGVVTKNGLSCPKGFPAINPVPREMIFSEVAGVVNAVGDLEETGDGLLIEISIPEGVRLAAMTFNPNLGIEGGISVLGTTGIVNPMSERALLETIRLDIRVRVAEGRVVLAVAPGNYGETFLREQLGISMDSFVKCSNFIGDAVRMMREEGVRRVLLAGHLGKLIKVAGGVLNTHSRYGDRRMEILADCAREAGLPDYIEKELLNRNTTEEAADFLKERGGLDTVMRAAAARIKRTLEECSGLAVEVVLFTNNCGILAMTEGAKALADAMRQERTREE